MKLFTNTLSKNEWITGINMMKLSLPVFFTFILQNSIGLIAVAFVGQLGIDELAAASLGNMFSNIMGFSVGIGFASAMDTLCSQAYGAGRLELLGIICQRAILILGILCIPLGGLWFHTEKILIGLGQNPKVSHLTGTYMKYQFIGLWPSFIYTSMNKYLQTQGQTKPSMHVLSIVAIINPFITYLLIYTFQLGFDGAALSVSICRILQALFLFIYIIIFQLHKNTWNGWSKECFKEWSTFLSLGLPGCIMICAEWWAAELLTFAAGWINEESLSAQAILSNISGLIFCIPLSFTIACSIRVGNRLGSGDAVLAQITWRMAVILAVSLVSIISFLMLIFRDTLPLIFTQEKSVIQLVSSTIPLLSTYVIIDCIQSVASGALRGCGKQKIGAICNLISYYCLGLPISYICCFKFHLGFMGLWIGNSIANIFQACVLVFIVSRINWLDQVNRAEKRLGINFNTTPLFKQVNKYQELKKTEENTSLINNKKRTWSFENLVESLPISAVTPTAGRLHVEPVNETSLSYSKSPSIHKRTEGSRNGPYNTLN